MATWRDLAKPIIEKVISENKGKSEKEIKAALRAVYPWGERKMHPYKIWCDECRKQLKKPNRKTVQFRAQNLSLFDEI